MVQYSCVHRGDYFLYNILVEIKEKHCDIRVETEIAENTKKFLQIAAKTFYT